MHERCPGQICARWAATDEGGGFANFVQDMGGYGTRPAHTRLSRHDKTRPFSPENCWWKPRKVETDASR